ncbi:hypothetical protein FKW77_002497 [Venturia effusa]|uniref:Cyclin-domain-containing protein n=1 Tax=Venturia effusa TaxID=50376 RepID=A0A517KVW6_9PEZI|nr:hypothetical protein FKW77_002497 [Venturia effusa]
MTSIVVSDVSHHQLPYAHIPSSHERRTPHPGYKSAPVGPIQTDAGGVYMPTAPMDIPMTDAAPARVPQSASASHTPSQPRANIPISGLLAPNTVDRQPPSPRFKGHSQAPTPRSTSSNFAPPRTLPSSSSPAAAPSSRTASISAATIASPSKIKVTSLAHIQSFVLDERNPLSQSASRLSRGESEMSPQYEISDMPVTDIIEMVAGLLTKITTTNDRQHEHLHRQISPPENTSGLSQQTTSVLAFHGKNIPSISILSYLSRIHKYCPTTYEVFLSLLVYFDRMTERVNSGPMQHMRQTSNQSLHAPMNEDSRHSSVPTSMGQTSPDTVSKAQQAATPPPSGSLGRPAETAKQLQEQDRPPSPPIPMDTSAAEEQYSLSHFFVVDSFNIHRLVIAGVTCASKFFSDIFYTNSRYAKVGGLPLPELNHLELQFLLLNDFRLAVPLEEMEAYGTMLVEFYAREVLANHARGSAQSSTVSLV